MDESYIVPFVIFLFVGTIILAFISIFIIRKILKKK